jgi:hypothetical protein
VIGENQNPQAETWKVLAPCSMNCRISQSSSRRTLIISESRDSLGHSTMWGTADSTYTVIDASSSPPRVVRTCSQMAFYAENITDQFAYWGNYDRDDDLMVRFPFCDVEHYEELRMWGGRGTSGFVLDDETLLKIGYTLAGPVSAEVVRSDGQVKLSVKMSEHDFIDPYAVRTDEGHDRFAFMVNTELGAHPRLDIGGHFVARRVVVYSEFGQELAPGGDTPLQGC